MTQSTDGANGENSPRTSGQYPGRIGYATGGGSLAGAADARRFVGYAQRRGIPFEIAEKGQEYDLVVMTEMADIPYWTRQSNAKLIFDMPNPQLRDDRKGVWRTRGVRFWVGRQTSTLHLSWRKVTHEALRRADAVVCCSMIDANDISRFNSNVRVILDGHFDFPLIEPTAEPSNDSFRILWEGMVTSLSWLPGLGDVFSRVARERSVEFVFVTDERISRNWMKIGSRPITEELHKYLPSAQFVQWTPESFSSEAARASLAIVPVNLQQLTWYSKPENRLILLWRAGLPVVTSATPAYVRTMQAAGLTDYCTTPDDWYSKLITLIDQPQELRNSAVLGSDYVKANHDLESWLSSWDSAIRSVM